MESNNRKGVSGPMISNRRQFLSRAAMGAGALALARPKESQARPRSGAVSSSPGAWKFGVMNDTQWTVPDDGYDPDTCAVGILKQIQQQFIAEKVKFVIHVGDLCDSGALPGEDIRALYAQPLYDNGIGFFPLRGNHDDGAPQAAECQALYPQTRNGIHNATPAAKIDAAVAAVGVADSVNLGIPAMPAPGSTFQVGVNFSSPDPAVVGDLRGLTYSFDLENARFILLDQFTPASPATEPMAPAYALATTIGTQQIWITQQLQGRYPGSHAFVFGHKGLVTCQHADVLFGNSPDLNPALTDAFINSLASNGVRYYIHGHDHMYDRSFVTTTTGSAKVTQILTSSNSSKFYVPAGSLTNSAANGGESNDVYYDVPAFGRRRRVPLSQQLNSVGFQIVTVDGANVTVEYYAVVVPINMSLSINVGATSELEIPSVSAYTFTRQETYGYGLQGKEFVVSSGGSYTVVQDNSAPVAAGRPTVAQILSGVNGSKATDANGVSLMKVVDTGWKAKAEASNSRTLASDILYLWGMGSALGSDQTDTFTLSLSYESAPATAANGGFGIGSFDENAGWVNAVDRNTGGTKQFVAGPWKSSYGLGTYGVDRATNTAWAVINCNGQFAVKNDIEAMPGLLG